jgi:hypothetical protein
MYALCFKNLAFPLSSFFKVPAAAMSLPCKSSDPRSLETTPPDNAWLGGHISESPRPASHPSNMVEVLARERAGVPSFSALRQDPPTPSDRSDSQPSCHGTVYYDSAISLAARAFEIIDVDVNSIDQGSLSSTTKSAPLPKTVRTLLGMREIKTV